MSAAAGEVKGGYRNISVETGLASEPAVGCRTQRDDGIQVAIQHSGRQHGLFSVSGVEPTRVAAFPQERVRVTIGWAVRQKRAAASAPASLPTTGTCGARTGRDTTRQPHRPAMTHCECVSAAVRLGDLSDSRVRWGGWSKRSRTGRDARCGAPPHTARR